MDSDWIEIAFIFDEGISEANVAKMFDILSDHPDRTSEEGEFNIVRFEETGTPVTTSGGANAAASVCVSSKSASITVPFDGFQIGVGPDSNRESLSSTPHLLFREEVHPFTDPQNESDTDVVKERRKRFVSVLADAASVLNPEWAFGRRGGIDIGSGETVLDLATSSSPPLFEYNFFNQRTVSALGRNRLLNAPVWYAEETEHGGVFLTVREPPFPCNQQQKSCVEAAQHLGLSLSDSL